jgi:hypothetical protein
VVSGCGKGALEASGRDQGDGAQSPTAPALLFYAGIDHGLLNAVDGEGVGAVPPRTASGSPAPGSTVPSTDRWHSPATVAAHDRLGVVSDEMRGWYPAHVLDGDVIYAQSPAGLFAFDARSGEPLWETRRRLAHPAAGCTSRAISWSQPSARGVADIARCGSLGGQQAFGPEHLAPHAAGRGQVPRLGYRRQPSLREFAQLTAFTLAAGELLWSVHSGGYGLLRAGDLIYTANDMPGWVTALSPDSGRQVCTTPTKD